MSNLPLIPAMKEAAERAILETDFGPNRLKTRNSFHVLSNPKNVLALISVVEEARAAFEPLVSVLRHYEAGEKVSMTMDQLRVAENALDRINTLTKKDTPQ